MKEMFNSLTTREKKLLFILLIFLLIMGSWFICIRPSLESYRKKSSELSNKTTTLAQLKSELKLYQEAPSQLASQTKSYNQLTKKYYTEKSNDQLSRLFSQKMEDYNLSPQSLTISDSNSTSSSSSSSSSTSSSSSDTSGESRVVSKSITITYTGSLDDTKSFLTSVNKDMKHVIVNSFSEGSSSSSDSSTTTTTSSENSSSSSDQSYTVGFDVYMVKK